MRTAALSVGGRAVATLVVLLGVLTVAAPPAVAHTQLARSTPQPGATVEQLADVRLQFHTPLLQTSGQHAIRLLGPDGTRWDDEQAPVVSNRVLAVGVAPELRQRGEYTVHWCAMTADGHLQSGAYTFSYAGPTSVSARPPGPAAEGACAPATAFDWSVAVIGWLLVGTITGSVLFLAVTALASRRRHTGQ